ncbi:hypothetical protein NQ315_017305 [Exocentrus adspersus]|uniref:Uncharacterized protein n=1 Tax=Exocentrus adspersus TaxID=1586481 RepID=A0AAV8VKW3_9CUCU|nr:hypothetical protein NQ315_017305 [Exocentrus adspersus]
MEVPSIHCPPPRKVQLLLQESESPDYITTATKNKVEHENKLERKKKRKCLQANLKKVFLKPALHPRMRPGPDPGTTRFMDSRFCILISKPSMIYDAIPVMVQEENILTTLRHAHVVLGFKSEEVIVLLLALATFCRGAVVVAPLARLADATFDPNPSYSFAYDVQDALTGNSKGQVESRANGVVQGQYNVADPDGTRRIVDYVADPVNGFNAVVRKAPQVVATAPVVEARAAPLSKVPGRMQK